MGFVYVHHDAHHGPNALTKDHLRSRRQLRGTSFLKSMDTMMLCLWINSKFPMDRQTHLYLPPQHYWQVPLQLTNCSQLLMIPMYMYSVPLPTSHRGKQEATALSISLYHSQEGPVAPGLWTLALVSSNYISEGSVSHINGVWPSFLTIRVIL